MKHFIFDFDGVLADSMPVWAGVYMGLLIDNGIEVPPDMIKDITPLGNSGAARYCIEHGLDMPHSTITNFVLEKIYDACRYARLFLDYVYRSVEFLDYTHRRQTSDR